MRKLLMAVLLICLFCLVACGGKVIADFGDAKAFEEALNNGDDLTGKIVIVTISDFKPQSAFGYNIIAGEHLNFVSSNNPNIKVGDTVSLKVSEVQSMLGSWIIKYEKVSNAEITDKTIVSENS